MTNPSDEKLDELIELALEDLGERIDAGEFHFKRMPGIAPGFREGAKWGCAHVRAEIEKGSELLSSFIIEGQKIQILALVALVKRQEPILKMASQEQKYLGADHYVPTFLAERAIKALSTPLDPSIASLFEGEK